MTELFENFVKILGGSFKNRETVHSLLMEEVVYADYRREKWLLTVGKRIIPMYILAPINADRCPAVLAHHQHNGEYHLGKSEPVGIMGNSRMYYAQMLVRQGFIVASWDALGFEERNNSLFGRFHEKFLATKALVEGTCLQREYTLDAMYVVDYLLTRDDVQSDRLATIGHSLGGQNVLFTLITDPRVKVGVSSCGIGTIKSFIEENVQHNMAWYVPGLLQLGDTTGLAPLLAGKSLFISQGLQDRLFPASGVREFFDAAKEHANVELCFFEGGHDFPDNVADKTVHFLKDKLFV